MQHAPQVLVVDADLLGLARLESAVHKARGTVRSITSSRLAETLAEGAVDIVIVDLDRGRTTALDSVDAARKSGDLPGKVVAFVSHVDEELAADARRRGLEVFARGRFWRSLEELLATG